LTSARTAVGSRPFRDQLAADAHRSLPMKLLECPSPVRWRITCWEGLSSPFVHYVVEVTITPGTQAVGRRIRYYGDGARDHRGQARQNVSIQVQRTPLSTAHAARRIASHVAIPSDLQCCPPEDEAKRSPRAGFRRESLPIIGRIQLIAISSSAGNEPATQTFLLYSGGPRGSGCRTSATKAPAFWPSTTLFNRGSVAAFLLLMRRRGSSDSAEH